MFRVVYKKTSKSNLEIREDLTMLQMGEYLENKKEYYELKIYQLNSNSMYEKALAYKNGELVRENEEVSFVKYPSFSISKLFETIQKVPPSRKGNLVQLMYDLMKHEDVTKPKLNVIDNKKS
ncbi:MAG: hypothetical protein M3000_18750 [Bacillus wiedmannii]|uniref:hypothetical protein n=1 Tax=Bacillus thuringiensis TaxID=1428 RepID=UPI0005AF1908|nr:hypothetical protein [Bacillus thuringiensis]MCT6917129.1 hypothetical protein [Bacillus wiedmannii]KIP29710.1 hypothetical protein BG10_7048 [Bacillus thuringiensis serovar morrisoni]MCT6948674.1 hypothetical protein [Bacillus thuringiensis]MED2076897.1 hypothetical protein [Bacillus thuringiensis]MEE2015296.1 hypothetical protein [Bacillus thuringiensis]